MEFENESRIEKRDIIKLNKFIEFQNRKKHCVSFIDYIQRLLNNNYTIMID